MRRGVVWRAVLALFVASACDGDRAPDQPDGRPPDAPTSDASSPDAARPPDGGAPDAGNGCALPPTEEWVGTASGDTVGGSGDDTSLAEVTWTREATDGCIDRYLPSGTATFILDGRGCFSPKHWIIEPPSAPIEPGDGELIIDRTASPAIYTMHGRSTWVATVRCSDAPPGTPREIGWVWADGGGSFDGAAFGASMERPQGQLTWAMFAADAVFTPPGDACSEPSSERWASIAYEDISSEAGDRAAKVAIATWTRVSTTGCVDHYRPSGIAEKRTEDTETCSPLSYDPGVIVRGDGTLTIDRSTDPATYRIGIAPSWDSTRRCTLPDGTVEATVEQVSGLWEAAHGVFDGDRFGAEVFRYRWEVGRLPSE